MKAKNQIQRRDFIRKSALTGTALASGAAFISAQSSPAPKSRSDNSIKIGLIGCGGRGTGATVQSLNANPNVWLVAMADIFQDKIDESLYLIKKEVPGRVDVPPERQFVGFEAYLSLIEQVDVVIHASPPGFRPLHAEAAVKASKHIFMEKPVAADIAGTLKLRNVQKMADEKGLCISVGLQRRYVPEIIEHVQQIHDGILGPVVCMSANGNFNRVSWLKNYPRSSVKTEMEYQMRNWYFFTWLSGDIIVEQTVHLIDAISWAKGEYPVEAQGSGGRHARVGPDVGEAYDHFAVEYTYRDGSKAYVFARQIQGAWTAFSSVVQGPDGYCSLGRSLHLTGKNPVKPKRDIIGGHQLEQTALIENIIAGRTRNDLEYGIPSTQMAILGRMAAYSGQIVKWDDAIASNEDLSPPSLTRSGFAHPMQWDTEPVPAGPLADGTYPCPIPGITKPW